MVSYGITALIILCFVYSYSQTTLAQEVQSLSSQPEQRSETGSSQSVGFYVWGQQPTSAATEQTLSAKDLELRLPLETFAGFQSRFDHIRVGLFDQTKRRRTIKRCNPSTTISHNKIQQTNGMVRATGDQANLLAASSDRSPLGQFLVQRRSSCQLWKCHPSDLSRRVGTLGDPFTAKAGITIHLW
jgi:hypothetical protein